jgi:hypothetical protein
MEYKIYCDMDGVLTNFEERFEHFSGTSPKHYEERFGQAGFWNLIDEEVGIKYWVGMKWMETGEELWKYIEPHNPTILTSPSRHNNSRLGKRLWVRNHIVPLPKIIFAFSKNKRQYAGENHILIDDREDNIEGFIKDGGIGIHCKDNNIEEVINQLQELGL